jgi:hypothetical protein
MEHLKRHNKELNVRLKQQEWLLTRLKSGTDFEASQLLARLRLGEGLEDLVTPLQTDEKIVGMPDSLPELSPSLSLSGANEGAQHQTFTQDHQLDSLELPAHLLQPLLLQASSTAADASHIMSRMQMNFVERARELIINSNPRTVLGPPTIDVSGVLVRPEVSMHEATDVQTWAKAFMHNICGQRFSDWCASIHLIHWFVRVSRAFDPGSFVADG